MMKKLQIRQDINVQELKTALKSEKNAAVYKRLLGIIHLIEGGKRQEAEEKMQMNASNVRRWIKRFNKDGLNGLAPLKRTGRPKKSNAKVDQILKDKVLGGPSEKEGLARYRLTDLQAFLEQEHGIFFGLSGLWYQLKRLGLSWKTGRQRHPKSDTATQNAFKKTSVTP